MHEVKIYVPWTSKVLPDFAPIHSPFTYVLSLRSDGSLSCASLSVVLTKCSTRGCNGNRKTYGRSVVTHFCCSVSSGYDQW
jgi:hypothetical protein